MENKERAFKTELLALLEKYNAEINYYIEGDTHCLIDWISLEMDGKEILRSDDGGLDAYDLRQDLA